MRRSAYTSIKIGGDAKVSIHEKLLKLNIPPAPFKGGDVTVNIYEKVCKLNIPPAPFKGGDVTVNIHEH